MAKRGILEHEKTLELAEKLEIMECYAVGILEVFWHWVAKYRPHGDVTDTKAILFAKAIRYTEDPNKLWQSLIDCRFIEKQDDGRLLIHDWSEHADNAVHQLLKTRSETFADGHLPFTRNKSRSNRKPRPAGESSQSDRKISQNDHENLQQFCAYQSQSQSQIPEPDTSSQIPEPEQPPPVSIDSGRSLNTRDPGVSFPEFWAEYTSQTAVAVNDADRIDANLAWDRLDLPTKIQAVQFLRNGLIDDRAPEKYKLPASYLRKTPWTRCSTGPQKPSIFDKYPKEMAGTDPYGGLGADEYYRLQTEKYLAERALSSKKAS